MIHNSSRARTTPLQLIRRALRSDTTLVILLSVLGLMVRLPNLMTVPVFQDETRQAIWAMQIWPGGQLLLSGFDSYVGPVFAYLLAVGYFFLGLDPAVARIVVVILAACTVGLTYLLARALGLQRTGSALATLLVLSNPHHILINSHLGWSNAIAGFFTTALLYALALAVNRQRVRLLLAAGLLAGLALQAHPVIALMLPGLLIWFVTDRRARRHMRSPWPYLAVLLALATYAVVIIHNLQTGFFGLEEAQLRSYIWQQDPTLNTYLSNFARLTTQLTQVAGGVLESTNAFGIIPVVFIVWLAAGLLTALKTRLWLPLFAVVSVWTLMPYFSNHYGTLITTRLTNHLTPPIAVMMAAAGEAFVRWLRQRLPNADKRRISTQTAMLVATSILFMGSIYPLIPLTRYYQSRITAQQTNAEFFSFHDLLRSTYHGSTVYVSESLDDLRIGDSGSVAYVIDLFLSLDQVSHEQLPAAHILERLIAKSERALLILHTRDLEILEPGVPLKLQSAEANTTALQRGYALYVVAANAKISKPDFVFASDADLSPQQIIDANFDDKIELWGIDLKMHSYRPGDVIELTVYWRTLRSMEFVYTGFVHLVGDLNPANNSPLWGQDDHELGRGMYRSVAWQRGEIVIERYTVPIPPDAPQGSYALHVGTYQSLSVQRLSRLDDNGIAADDKAIVGQINIEP